VSAPTTTFAARLKFTQLSDGDYAVDLDGVQIPGHVTRAHARLWHVYTGPGETGFVGQRSTLRLGGAALVRNALPCGHCPCCLTKKDVP
jgi:hypothetical protein